MQAETSIRPGRPTLRIVAEELRRIGSHPETVDWASVALPAVRAAIVAVEGELDALYSRDVQGDMVAQSEPRLLHAVGQLEADLARELVSLWEMKEASLSGVSKEDATSAAARLVKLAERSLELVYESFRGTEAMG